VIIFTCNPLTVTSENKFKLQKFTCHYYRRKYSFCSRVVNIWNGLPDYVVEADSVNKNRLHKLYINQYVVYNHNCELTGTGDPPVSM